MAKSKAYEMAVKIAGKVDKSLKTSCDDVEKAMNGIGNAAKSAAKVTAAAFAAVSAVAIAGGKALYDLGTEFDGAYDAIRIGTGATGEKLEELQNSMLAVYSSVPGEMATAATAIADYNTRLDITGETLETLSAQALHLNNIIGEDVSTTVEKSSQAFQQWAIAEENMADAMDYIFKVSQSTGTGFNVLMGDLQLYGAQLQSMGYTFEESAAMIGQMEKAGVNFEEVLAAMKKSVTAMAKEGISASTGLEKYYKAISEATTETEAITIASEVFGTRAASTMASAIRNGSMSVQDLTQSLIENGETIAIAAADTYDLSEKWQLFKQRAKVAMEPIAMKLFDAVGEAMDKVMPKLEWFFNTAIPAIIAELEKVAADVFPKIKAAVAAVVPVIQKMAKWVLENKDLLIAITAGVIGAVAAYKAYKVAITAYNAVMGIYKIVTAASATGTFTLAGAMTALNLPVLAVVAAIGLLVAAGVLLYKNWDTVKAKAQEIWGKVTEVWNNIKTAVSTAISDMVTAFQEKFPLMSAFISGWWESIQAAWDNVKAIFSNIIDFVKNVFAGDWSAAWDNIVNIFGNLFGMIVNLAKAPINGVISAINFVLEKINGISVTIPDWVPGAGGKTLGFNIPTIPALASGGIATAATLAMVGEGGEPEAIMPLSKLAALLDEWNPKPQPGGAGADGGDNQIIFAPVFNFHGSASKADVEAATRTSFEEFKTMYRRLKAEERRKSFSPA